MATLQQKEAAPTTTLQQQMDKGRSKHNNPQGKPQQREDLLTLAYNTISVERGG
jgi:hypothetical protein